MKGTLVNVAAVLAGNGAGLAIGGRLPERGKGIITAALGTLRGASEGGGRPPPNVIIPPQEVRPDGPC